MGVTRVNHILLLGAGFSRNWGGWLAAEAFEYLLGFPRVRTNPALKTLLWKHQSSGGFEDALAELQESCSRDPVANRPLLDALQGAIEAMFEDMNAGFSEGRRFETSFDVEFSVVRFLSRFDVIFTLNQDLLLERHYLTANLANGPYRNWAGHSLPGMQPAPGAPVEDIHYWSTSRWVPRPGAEFQLEGDKQALVKLHGSSNWTAGSGSSLMVIGGQKVREIQLHPVLSWYSQLFEEALGRPKTRLMIIGYGFRDSHVNDAIRHAVTKHALEMFIIGPLGSEQARALNPTRHTGLIKAPTDLERIFEQSLIGASRRALHEIFGRDRIEFAKVDRFFAD